MIVLNILININTKIVWKVKEDEKFIIHVNNYYVWLSYAIN